MSKYQRIIGHIKWKLNTKKRLHNEIGRLNDQVTDLTHQLLEKEPSPLLIQRLESALKMAEKHGFYKSVPDYDRALQENQRVVGLAGPLLEKAKTKKLTQKELTNFYQEAYFRQEDPTGKYNHEV